MYLCHPIQPFGIGHEGTRASLSEWKEQSQMKFKNHPKWIPRIIPQ
jgi:hypothetical protein